MSRYLYGIDPGLKGGVTRINLDTMSVRCWATPIIKGKAAKKGVRGGKIAAIKDEYDPLEMAKLIEDDQIVYIEQVGAMPKQGVTSMFRFGFGAGLWHGIAGARRSVLGLVRPQAWKAFYGLHDDKNDSREMATKLAPDLAVFWPLVKHDGIAESFLIANFALANMDERIARVYKLESEV